MADALRAKVPSSKSTRASNGRKVKKSPWATAKNQHPTPGSTQSSVLPRIDRRGEAPQQQQTPAFLASLTSPKGKDVSPPLRSRRASAKDSKTKVETSPTYHEDDLEGPSVKSAWYTPRKSAEEEPSSESHVASFFADSGGDGGSDDCSLNIPTALRLKSVEESINASEERYRVDMEQLSASNDKFFEISTSANQHVEAIHDQLPIISDTFQQTSSALQNLSGDIAALHDQQELAKKQMFDQFEAAMGTSADEMVALTESHAAEKTKLLQLHECELRDAEATFRQKVLEIEDAHKAAEKSRLDELQQLRETSAAQVQTLKETARAEREESERLTSARIEAIETGAKKELAELRIRTMTEYEELAQRSQSEFAELKQRSEAELADVKSTLTKEITALRSSSAVEIAALTETSTRELKELRERKDEALRLLQTEYASERAQLVEKASEEIARLRMFEIDQSTQMEARRCKETKALRDELQATETVYRTQIQDLHYKYTHDIEQVTTVASNEKSTLLAMHAEEVEELTTQAASKLSETISSYEARLSALAEIHTAQTSQSVEAAAQAREALITNYEQALSTLRDERVRERDTLVLRYETELDAFKRASREEHEKHAKLHEGQVAQLRETHSSKVLALEMALRDERKQNEERVREKDAELERKCENIEKLEAIQVELKAQHKDYVERSLESIERKHMEISERESELLSLQQVKLEKETLLDAANRELKVAEDDLQMKASTILELTFVVKSRDDEIEKLHRSLLDTVQNVNTKTEILELTAETLSSKTKELEDAKAALRVESGRLSMVEESMHQKEGLLENTELKIESMRLNMENMRLEMKRMQMDMKLQLEHTEGEIELKNGEIRRLHGSQTELRQKNDFCQQTIERLEESLAFAKRQSEEAQRRIDLLHLEATHSTEEMKVVRDELLGKERDLLVMTKSKQTIAAEKQRLQIQVNNMSHVIQNLHEKVERNAMRAEEIQALGQRLLEETSAEKDERMRSEKHILMLELLASKDMVRHLEGVEGRLSEMTQKFEDLNSEKLKLDVEIQALNEEVKRREEAERVLHEQVNGQIKRLDEQSGALTLLSEKFCKSEEEARRCLGLLQMEKEDSRERLRVLLREKLKLVDANDKMRADLSNLRDEKEQLKLSMGQEKREIVNHAEKLQEDLAGVKASLIQTKSDLSDSQHALHEKLKELAYLQENLEEQTAKTREVKASLDELSGVHEEQQTEFSRLKNAFVEENRRDQEHIQALKNELEAKAEAYRAQQQLLSVKVAEYHALQQSLEDLRQEQREKTAHVAAEHERQIDQLVEGHQHQLEQLVSEHQSRMDQLTTERQEQVNHSTTEHQKRVDQLVTEHQEQVKQMKTEHQEHIDQLMAMHQEQVHQLVVEREEKIGQLTIDHQSQIEQMTAENRDTVGALQEDYEAKAIAIISRHKGEIKQERAANRYAEEEKQRLLEKQRELQREAAENHVRLTCTHSLELLTLRVAHTDDIASRDAHMVEMEKLHVNQLNAIKSLNAELKAAHSQKLLETQMMHQTNTEAAIRVAREHNEQTIKEHKDAIEQLTASLKQESELARLRLTEEHLTKTNELLERSRAEEEQHKAALAEKQEELTVKTEALANAARQVNELGMSMKDLQVQLQHTRQEVAERDDVVAAKNATIDNVRKELNLLLESSKMTRSSEQFVALLRQQLETYMMEVYHMNLNELEGFALEEEKDLLECLKGFFAMRCRPRPVTQKVENRLEANAIVLSVDNVCNRLQEYERVLSVIEDRAALTAEPNESDSPSQRIGLLNGELSKLKLRVRQLFVSGDDSNGENSSCDIDTLLRLLDQNVVLFKTLAIPGVPGEAFIRGQQVISMLKEHEQLMLDAKASCMRDEIRSMGDIAHVFTSIEEVLNRARQVTGSSSITKPRDLMTLLDEWEHLRHQLDISPLDENSLPASAERNLLGSVEILASRHAATRFEQRCKDALHLHGTPRTSMDDIVEAIQQLMKILENFEQLQPKLGSPRRHPATASLDFPLSNTLDNAGDEVSDNSTTSPTTYMPSIQNKVTAVLAFVEELKLMSDFAQNILEEDGAEEGQTTSNTSSNASLATLRALARTPSPTPTADELQIDVELGVDDGIEGDDEQICKFSDDGDDQERTAGFSLSTEEDPSSRSPSPFLAESLMDISLVMSDHQRLLSQTARWVSRSRQAGTRGQTSDLGAEIGRLVREHCALLSLARRLFKLKNPRQELASLLEGIALLEQLTARLSIFRPTVNCDGNSDNNSGDPLLGAEEFGSAASLGKSDDEFFQGESLSVFESMGTIARHLQDYDYFLENTEMNIDGLSNGTLKIEDLVRDMNEQASLVARTQELLRLDNPAQELPQVLLGMQEVLRQGEELRISTAIPQPKPGDTGDDQRNDGDSNMSEVQPESDDIANNDRIEPPQGVEALLAGMDAVAEDLQSYSELTSWMKQVLSLPESVESVGSVGLLQDRLMEVLAQLETLTSGHAALKKELMQMENQRNEMVQESLSEAAILSEIDALQAQPSSVASTRQDVLKTLLKTQQVALDETRKREVDAATEAGFLRERGLLLVDGRGDKNGSSQVTADPKDPDNVLSVKLRLAIYERLLNEVEYLRGEKSTVELNLAEVTQRGSEEIARLETELVDTKENYESQMVEIKECLETELAETTKRLENELAETKERFEVLLADTKERFETEMGDAKEQFAIGIADTKGQLEAQLLHTNQRHENELIDTNQRHKDELMDTKLRLETQLADTKQQMKAGLAAEREFLENQEVFSSFLVIEDPVESSFSRMQVFRQLADEMARLFKDQQDDEDRAAREYEFILEHDLVPVPIESADGMKRNPVVLASRSAPSGSLLSTLRLKIFQQLVDMLAQQRERKEEVVQECNFLQENSLPFNLDEPHDARMAVYKALLAGQNALIEEKMEREVIHERQKAFLVAHGAPELETPLEVYELYVQARHTLAQLAADMNEEIHFLAENNMCSSEELASEAAEPTARFSSSLRLLVYRRALRAQIDAREAQQLHQEEMQQQLRSQRVADEYTIATLTAKVERLEAALMAWHETVFVPQRAWDSMLLEEEEKRRSLTRQCEDAQKQAAETHTQELGEVTKARENAEALAAATHAEALEQVAADYEKRLAAAKDQQARQLELAAFVQVEQEAHTTTTSDTAEHSDGTSSLSGLQARAFVLDKLARRDTTAVNMIYRAIRLATEILNASPAEASGATSTRTTSEIPAEVTQAVLTCVKELKALKEFLVQSLEQVTREGDALSPSATPAPFSKWTADAIARATADKECAIDLALCSHREFMSFAHLQLLTRREATDRALSRLYKKLGAAAAQGAFTADQEKLLALEVEVTREREAREDVDCKFRLNEEYYRRLLDERKEVEVAQTTAVDRLREESKALKLKLNEMEQQLQHRQQHPPMQSRPPSAAALLSSPRAPMLPSSTPHMLKNAISPTFPTPKRPERPRGGGSAHKERFVSDLERETGQRHTSVGGRRLNGVKVRAEAFPEDVASPLEEDFQAMQAAAATATVAATDIATVTTSRPVTTTTVAPATAPGSSLQNQELWYQGARSIRYVSFFFSLFHVPRQQLFRVEVFNSDTEQQQQTVYVTWAEMHTFVQESRKAARLGVVLPDDPELAATVSPQMRYEIADVLFERVRVYGEGTDNILLGFE